MTKYFAQAGDYTQKVIKSVIKYLQENDITQIVLASSKGRTAYQFYNAISEFTLKNEKSIDLVVVTHQSGFREPGKIEFPKDIQLELEEKGITFVTATHALAGVDRAVRKKHGTWQISELIAETLRTFGQGTKVCAEISLMAADAGALQMDPIIAVGGTGHGADTAWVIKPTHTHTYFDLQMQELLCKPKKL
jgi:hypothetical protein